MSAAAMRTSTSREPPRRAAPGSPAHRRDGFTLIEVLVALTILAVALAAAVRSAGVAADGAFELKERLLGTWIAQDRLAEYAARPLWPDVGARTGATEQAGLQFTWRETVSPTPNAGFRRIEVQVSPAHAPDRIAATLVGYAARSERQ